MEPAASSPLCANSDHLTLAIHGAENSIRSLRVPSRGNADVSRHCCFFATTEVEAALVIAVHPSCSLKQASSLENRFLEGWMSMQKSPCPQSK
jgi:hypothetical protein